MVLHCAEADEGRGAISASVLPLAVSPLEIFAPKGPIEGAPWKGLFIAALGHVLLAGGAAFLSDRLSGTSVETVPIEIELVSEANPDVAMPESLEASAGDRVVAQPETEYVLSSQHVPNKVENRPTDMMTKMTPEALEAPKPIQTQRRSAPSRQQLSGENVVLNDQYRLTVATKIAQNKPSAKVAAAAQGTVLVAFSIGPDGYITNTRIAQSSGNGALDQAAIQSVSKSSPFPPPPLATARSFTVPIRFRTGQ